MSFQKTLLLVIAFIYLTLAILYAILTPPWEAPDEPAHYRYVSQLAETWHPPADSGIRQTTSFAKDYAYISSNYEWFEPAIGYLPAAIAYQIIKVVAPRSLPEQIPPQNPLFAQNSQQYPNLFLSSNNGLLNVWQGNEGLLALRVFLALWGLGVIFIAAHVGNLLDPSGSLGIITAGWIAFLPQFTFISASVRNDTVTNFVAALVLLLAIKIQFDPGRINRYALGLGILIGIGVLCKYTFLYIPVIAIVAIPLGNLRAPKSWIKPFLWLLIPPSVFVGAYYWTFPGAFDALQYTFNTTLALKGIPFFLQHLSLALESLFVTLFYAGFGWANVIPPSIWARIAFGIWLIGTSVTVLQLITGIIRRIDSSSLRVIILVGFAWIAACAGALRVNLAEFQPQGRFLFPVLVAWSILGFWGAWQILSKRNQFLLAIASAGFMLIFNAYALFGVLIPAYYQTLP